MMSVKDVLKIPIKDLMEDGSLLAVWSTNKPSQIQEFLQGLHTWGVEHVATWYWLKVLVKHSLHITCINFRVS